MIQSDLPLEDRYRVYNLIHPFLWNYTQRCDVNETILVDFDLNKAENFTIHIKDEHECCQFLKRRYIDTVRRIKNIGDDEDSESEKKPKTERPIEDLDLDSDDYEDSDYPDYYDDYIMTEEEYKFIEDYQDVKSTCEENESNVLIVITGANKEMFISTYNLSDHFLIDNHNYFTCEIDEEDESIERNWNKILKTFYEEENIRNITKNMKLENYSNDSVVLLVGTFGNNKIYGSILGYDGAINTLKRWLVRNDKIEDFKNTYRNRGEHMVIICAFGNYCRHFFITKKYDKVKEIEVIEDENENESKKTPVKRAPRKTATQRKAAARRTTARKTAPRKTVARKTAPKKAPVKKASTKKAPAKKTSVKKTSVKKASVKKASVKKTPAKKTSVKKVVDEASDDSVSDEDVSVDSPSEEELSDEPKKTTRKTARKISTKSTRGRKTATSTRGRSTKGRSTRGRSTRGRSTRGRNVKAANRTANA